MKLIVAIVSNDDSASVVNTLMNESFQVTKLATTGGFLRAGNTTLLIGTEDGKVAQCIDLIGRESCKRTEVVPMSASVENTRLEPYPLEVKVGGATIFVLNVEQFIKV